MYKLNGPTEADGVNIGNMQIPNDPLNGDWQEYLKWKAEGNEPEPWKTQEELDAMAAAQDRLAGVQQAKRDTGIEDITPSQAREWIDQEFASATTNAEVVAVIKRVLKKIVVHLLR